MTLSILNQPFRIAALGLLLALASTCLQADPAEARITAPAGPLTVATNQAVTFTATSTDSVGRDGYTVNSFSWSFGDGTTGAGPGTTHAYSSPGTYTATLTVSYTARICKRMDYEGNCLSYLAFNYTASANRTITVLAPPSISSFTASAVSVGVGKPVTLTWATANAASLSLTGQGAVSGTTLTVYPTAPTTYTLTASNAVGSVSASVSVTTYTVGVSLSPGSVSLLLGESRAFTAAVAPANLGVSWSTSGGTLSGSTPTGTVYSATASGSYTVVATSAEDPSKSASATVNVATVSIATPVPTPASAQTFTGGTVAFTALVSGAVDTGVTWAVNGGGDITASGVFRATARGDWTITATSKADPTRSASALVHVLPVVVAVSPPQATVRSGQTQAFTASVEGPGTPSQVVTWQVVGANSGTITPEGIYTAPETPGDYTVRAVSNQDSASVASATVHVPGWALKWRKDIVYVGAKEIAEVDAQGVHVTLVDHLGSPRFQVGPSGMVESIQKFLPFGESLTDPASAATFAKGFTNHEQTDSSGLIYMQARFYAPWYGRFLSPDPARDQHFEETQSWNIYSYCQNDPTMKIDPTGMWGWKDFKNWVFGPERKYSSSETSSKHQQMDTKVTRESWDNHTAVTTQKNGSEGDAGIAPPFAGATATAAFRRDEVSSTYFGDRLDITFFREGSVANLDASLGVKPDPENKGAALDAGLEISGPQVSAGMSIGFNIFGINFTLASVEAGVAHTPITAKVEAGYTVKEGVKAKGKLGAYGGGVKLKAKVGGVNPSTIKPPPPKKDKKSKTSSN